MTTTSTMFIGAALAMAAVAAKAPAQEPDGKKLYSENCRTCHGVTGVPPKAMQRKFPKIAAFDAKFLAGRSDDSIVAILARPKNDNMTSFKDKLDHKEAEAVAKYVRELGPKTP